MFILTTLLAGCGWDTQIQGCPIELVDLSPDESYGAFDSPRQVVSDWQGWMFTGMQGIPDSTVTVFADQATATVRVEDLDCDAPAGDQIEYLVPATVEVGTEVYPGWASRDHAHTIEIRDVPGPELASWLAQQVETHEADPEFFEFAIAWSVDHQQVGVHAYTRQSDQDFTEYDWHRIEVFLQDFSVQAP